MAADLAAPGAFEGKPIAEVRFVPQSQPLTRADIARLVPLKTGSPLHMAEVREALKRLYATGEYSSIEVQAEAAGNGVNLVIHTTEQWFVGPVEVDGKVNLPPNEGQLANATRLQLGTAYEDADLDSAVKGIQDLFERNGLRMAKVTPKVEKKDEHQQVAFTFEVEAGKRARLTLPEVTGDTKLPPEEVAKAAKYKGWFRWKPATQQNTQAGLENIRNKYGKEDRLTANVTLDRLDYIPDENRVKPVIRADGGPKVEIKTDGAKVSSGDLKKYVPVFDEETVNQDLLVRGARNLRDYFQNKGYFDVDVNFQSKEGGPDSRIITYTITPGERHKVVSVEVTGNKYFTTDQIRERMYLQPAGLLRMRRGRYSSSFERRDIEAIEALYRDSGFRDCVVNIEAQDDYQGRPGRVAINVQVEEGPQYLVKSLDVEGITLKERDQMLSVISSNPGQPFSETSVAADRDALLNHYLAGGYPDANFDFKVAPGDDPHQMKVTYRITEGQPRYVRDVLITGMHTTRGRLINPNVLLKPGDPLSWTQMGRMQRRLYNLGVFDKVDMAIQNPDGDIQNKYVLFNLTEGHRYYMALGFGAELARIGGNQQQLDSPSGATGFAPRGSLEFSRLNFLGLGHSINFKGRYSTLDRRVSLNYLAPRFHNVEGRNISATALYDHSRDVLTFTARRLEGSFQVTQQLSKPTSIMGRVFWRLSQVDAQTLKVDPALRPALSRPARMAGFGFNYIQDRRDDPTDAHRGIYNTVDTQFVDGVFGGNKNYLRILARNSYYKRVSRATVIASNTQFGWIAPFNLPSGENGAMYVPIAERFYGGGSATNRGFPDNQAGPRDLLTGFPIGGNALLFHATEFRFPLLGDNMQGVFFHDLGNVYTDLSSVSFRLHQKDLKDFNYLVHAAGFGIRYRTPVGPLRVDLAYSFNPPSFNSLSGTLADLNNGTAIPQVRSVPKFHFFISIGQAF